MSILGMLYLLYLLAHPYLGTLHSRDAEPTSGIFRFSDSVGQPDPYCNDYDSKIKGTGAAIVIDNGEKIPVLPFFTIIFLLGSSQMRVGWSGEQEPRLKFRNCVARTRGRKVGLY